MAFKRLEEEFLKVKDDSLSFIRFFETNRDTIDELDDKDEDQRGFKLRMNGDYGLCLATSGNTEKAVHVLTTFIPRFEKESGLTETELLTTPYYEHLLWAFGSSLYYTENIDETEKIFERLVRLQPDNRKYKNWLVGTKEKRFSSVRKGLFISIFAWLFIDILFIRAIDSPFKSIFWLGGAIIVVGMIALEVYIFLMKRNFR